MRGDIRLDGGGIAALAQPADDFIESVFFAGNGRMGTRGYSPFEEERRPVQTGLFAAGIFGEIKPGITDFVNLPTPICEDIYIDGVKAAVSFPADIRLDFCGGNFSLRCMVNAKGKSASVLHERFFPLSRPGLLVQRTTVTAQSGDIYEIAIESGVYTASCNNPIPDDQVKENNEWVRLAEETGFCETENGFTLSFETLGTGLRISEETAFCAGKSLGKGCVRGKDGVTKRFCAAAPYAAFTLEKATAVLTSRDKDPLIAALPEGWSFDALLDESKSEWQKRFSVSAIEIDGDENAQNAQNALRYCVFQLIANCSARDDSVNIGARGLTHTRYKGCYFWDTDFFMMPFYLLTNPGAAKSLMQYRVNALPAAKANSERMNTAGARYPWMASFDASEQCESWDIGASEVHVTADIVFALQQYIDISGDAEFYENGAAEVYIETARFWQSRYTVTPDGKTANLLFCKGPDEYCGITSNNLFTNVLVKYNLSLAEKAAKMLKEKHQSMYKRLKISEQETESWLRLRDMVPIAKNPKNGNYRTDDSFHLLETVDISTLKSGDGASYHDICFDRLQRYRVVKQADVLLLMTRMKEHFTREERLAAWQDFEPLCLHDSTLSFASHAFFAAQNGLPEDARRYFEKALYLDLKEVMGNTGKEGLHLANFGETWQAVVFGFAGLHFTQDGPRLAPCLPEGWERLVAKFYYRGGLYELSVTKTSAAVTRVE